ncbi:MAG: hypothetical protein KF758_11665 [Anaerolineales bacterium]|nr:hypothetical protein [Anaerolineales bacterium]
MSSTTKSGYLKQYKVFLASPGDVNDERDAVEKVINDFNNDIGERRGAIFTLLRWEKDAIPYFHIGGAQGAVDAQMNIEECSVFIGIFWKRLGTPTQDGKTGTEHEFWIAHNNWEKFGKPEIMLFRSRAPIDIDPSKFTMDAMQQNAKLNEFLDNTKIRSQLITSYDGPQEFKEIFRSWFTRKAQNILDGKLSIPEPQPPKDDTEMLSKLKFSKKYWKPLTYNILKKYYVELPEVDAIDFFEGRDPTWKESISTSVARREIVSSIKNEILRTNVSSPYIVLLRGLGGEGKSTALQQAIYESVVEKQGLYILWHEDLNSPLDLEIIDEIADTEYEWIIASDDAQNIDKDLFEAVKYIRKNNIKNIRFLLATKDLDWKKADGYGWDRYAKFNPITTMELTKKDAEDIVKKWRKYGEQGLGKLNENPSPEEELFKLAQTEKSSNRSLLGAMLKVRTGRTLQEHIRPTLDRLEETKVIGNITLRRATAYIAALHSYNIKILNSDILSHALGFKVTEYLSELTEKIIKPLGKEIVAEKYILIRHASIAEAIKDILSEYYDFKQITRKLLNSALTLYSMQKELRTTGIYVEIEINKWNQLPKEIFFDKEDESMGIELAKEAIISNVDKGGKFSAYSVTGLANLYEKSKQRDKAVKVYRDYYSKTKVTRTYYYEWGVVEGKNQNNYINIWLIGIALADSTFEYKGRDELRHLWTSLSGLSSSFKNAYNKTQNLKFLNACYSSAITGLASNPDERASQNMFDCIEFAKQEGAQSSNNDFINILEGIKLACLNYKEDLQEEDIDVFGKFPEGVQSFEKLGFSWLKGEINKRAD